MSDLVTIPARRGKAAFAAKGQIIKVINTHGEQVVDTWAFNRADLTEFMSMEHSRAGMLKLIPKVGDALLTNHRRPILTVLEDTSGGIHDTVMAACDIYRYQGLGVADYHDNCTDNLAQSMRDIGLTPPETPSPLNLFMNIPWTIEGGAVVRSAGVDAGLPHRVAGGDGSGDRVLGLPAGYPADQRQGREADRGTFRDWLKGRRDSAIAHGDRQHTDDLPRRASSRGQNLGMLSVRRRVACGSRRNVRCGRRCARRPGSVRSGIPRRVCRVHADRLAP